MCSTGWWAVTVAVLQPRLFNVKKAFSWPPCILVLANLRSGNGNIVRVESHEMKKYSLLTVRVRPQREAALFGGLRSVAEAVRVQRGAQEGRPLQGGQEARVCGRGLQGQPVERQGWVDGVECGVGGDGCGAHRGLIVVFMTNII